MLHTRVVIAEVHKTMQFSPNLGTLEGGHASK